MSHTALLVALSLLMLSGNCHAQWLPYYKSTDSAVYYYNDEKKNKAGEVVSVWTRIDDGYPVKLEIDCATSTCKSQRRQQKEIAPGTHLDSLEKILCRKPAEVKK